MKPIFEKVKDFVAKRQLENMQAQLERQTGLMDYIAMMADVEIPSEEGEEDVV